MDQRLTSQLERVPVYVSQLLAALVVTVFFLWVAAPETASAAWYSSSWSYRTGITIDSTKVSGTANLANFPVLIAATNTAWKYTEYGGHVGVVSGSDILFTASDGTTKLSHEIEYYSPSTGELVAWVNIPALSTSTDTVLYAYYGFATTTNQALPTSVWSSGYASVWHLSDNDASQAVVESTSNGNNGTNTEATINRSLAGQIARGLNYGDNADRTTLDSLIGLDIKGNITISAWVFYNPAGENSIIFSRDDGQEVTNADVRLLIAAEGNTLTLTSSATGNYTGGPTVDDNRWRYVVATRNGGTVTYYVDGTSTVSGVSNSDLFAENAASAAIGNDFEWKQNFEGYLDEVRVSSVARSGSWIVTEYNNQASPGTFFSLGDEERTVTVAFSTSSGSVSELAGSVSITLFLSATSASPVTVQYAATGGSATNGIDYSLVAGTSTIASGNTTTSISLTILDDFVSEGIETVIITLSNPAPSDVALGTSTSFTLSIIDDIEPGGGSFFFIPPLEDLVFPGVGTGAAAALPSPSGDVPGLALPETPLSVSALEAVLLDRMRALIALLVKLVAQLTVSLASYGSR